jgi:RNA polymerase sigma factor (sigma-70 family)
MNPDQGLADRFQEHREHLHGIAYRMLGSPNEADDAVQEAWLKLASADAGAVRNLRGWLQTVVSRVCLDMLRSRQSRREHLSGQQMPEENRLAGTVGDPEREALMADSVGRALLVVLNTLAPPERVAFVLHDMFGVPFDEIAPIVDRTQVAAKKLASRARAKVRGTPAIEGAELAGRRAVVDAFLAASRAGNIDAVVAVLAPDVVRRADRVAVPEGRPLEVRGIASVSKEIVIFGRNARFAQPALVNGSIGVVVAPRGRLQLAISFAIEADKITAYELVGDPERLRTFRFGVLDGQDHTR